MPSLSDWLDLTRREYLRRFVPGGGSAIKFVLGSDRVLREVQNRLRLLATEGGLEFFSIDAASTKIHMIQDIFFVFARNVDWEGLAQTWVEEAFQRNRYIWPRSGQSISLRDLAETNDVDETLLRREVHRWLAQEIMRDNQLTQDFRSAMANLCLRRMEMADERAAAPVVEWLKGDLRTIAALRQVPITARITRHNGRTMLRSLCHWLRRCGVPGIVATLDIRQLGLERGASTEGIRFGPAAVLDAYEVLRQLIDGAESFQGLFLAVLADAAFRDDDSRRSVNRYPALKQRIWPDVHARGHENPLTPLVELADDSAYPTRELLEMPYNEERVAVEALRAGVPNRAAIRALGSFEHDLCDRFVDRLHRSRENLRSGPAVEGELIAGTFGAGKSHLLGFLAEQALRENFIVSIVPVSKETPLFDVQKVYSTAVRNAIVPDRVDDVMTVVLNRLDPKADSFADLENWVSDASTGFSSIFAALLFLLPKQVILPEDIASMARFFGGAGLPLPRVRQWLRLAGASRLFVLSHTKAAELALQRLRFAPRLFATAGYRGWCILLDEADLIARYSTLQRGNSYAEFCRWLNLDDAVSVPGIVTVAAITSDFADEVLHRRLDQERVPEILQGKGREEQARLAEIGMTFIERQATRLVRPSEESLQVSLDTVRKLYGSSYGWPAYGGDIGERRANRTMREYIKAWTTAWDLRRLYALEDEMEIETIAPDYSEDTAFERPPNDDLPDEELQ